MDCRCFLSGRVESVWQNNWRPAMLVLDYDQLVAIAQKYDRQSHSTSPPVQEPRRDEGKELSHWEVAKACEEAMGPNGNGFVAVRGMKNHAILRNRLLRLAQKLALMPSFERATILKEHGLGTDVPLKDPGRPVSSFAAQLRFEGPSEPEEIGPTSIDDRSSLNTKWNSEGHNFCDLGSLFKQLGMYMVEVGLLVARICDATRSHGSMCEGSVEQAILESGTAKGRLIHYHSLLEQETLSSLHKNLHKGHKENKFASRGRKEGVSNLAINSGDSVSTRWQQWHCDYGIFTVLTSPLFLKPKRVVPSVIDDLIKGGCCQENVPTERAENSPRPDWQPLPSSLVSDLNCRIQECAPPDEHSSLLVMDSCGQTTSLLVPADHLIVQVGEAAQLLSGGQLVARAHCVLRPTIAEDVSRETMAVFLQPAWDRRMCLPRGILPGRALEAGGIATHMETHIPLLASRWAEGCTFAEFSKKTTAQYYGADGHQTRR